MLRLHPMLALLVLAGCSAASQPSAPVRAAAAERPVVIELYQSQGCSSCPPALVVLDQEAKRADVIALNFAVTYWDQLGWKDRFAKPEFTARQWDYARAGGRGNVQTPQLIVDGRQAVLGSVKHDVDAAIAAAQPTKGPAITVTGNRAAIGTGKGAGTVWFVTYDPRAIAVPVGAGENGGRTLVHRNIVKSLVSVGNWNGSAADYSLPSVAPGLAKVLLIQQDRGGPIIAAKRV